MALTKHGQSPQVKRTGAYRAWEAMRQRCQNPKNQDFDRYGGRGIRVSERWQTFEGFFADMGPRPSAKHSLDRYPNNDGNYEPGNCRWATRIEQSRNKSNNRLLSFRGREQSLAAWAEELGISPRILVNRLWRGWSVDRALTYPVTMARSGPRCLRGDNRNGAAT